MKNKTAEQNIAIIYAVGFFIISTLGHIPGLENHEGRLFGLFHLDMIDDALHLLSGIWALGAGLKSRGATLFYFKTFGTVYFLDGIVGLMTGYNFLNLHFLGNEPAIEGMRRVGVNIPHIAIGGSAVIFGFINSKPSKQTKKRVV